MTDKNDETIAAQEVNIRLMRKITASQQRTMATQQETITVLQDTVRVEAESVQLLKKIRWNYLAVAFLAGAAIGGVFIHLISWVAR